MARTFKAKISQSLRRSHLPELVTPPASCAPTACVIPALGVQNVVYRATDGRRHELWRDVAGTTGTTNLTNAANAPTADGDPFAYVDATAGQEIVVYSGSDRNVHSLYWSTGPIGHNNLSGSVDAPKAAGDPVGFFTPATNTHHVVYRDHDDHLRVMW